MGGWPLINGWILQPSTVCICIYMQPPWWPVIQDGDLQNSLKHEESVSEYKEWSEAAGLEATQIGQAGSKTGDVTFMTNKHMKMVALWTDWTTAIKLYQQTPPWDLPSSPLLLDCLNWGCTNQLNEDSRSIHELVSLSSATSWWLNQNHYILVVESPIFLIWLSILRFDP